MSPVSAAAVRSNSFLIVPKNWPLRRLEEWDAIRDEIGDALGGEGSDRWLTIVFTTDEEWAV
jgi:predicted Co/Zn/Cd cation transporter (cation efflux family)